MYAVITTDEYKELLSAQQNAKEYFDDLCTMCAEYEKVEANFKELLLMLTKGETEVKWRDNNFGWFDLEKGEGIAEYINNNYVSNGILQFDKVNKVKENTDEQGN